MKLPSLAHTALVTLLGVGAVACGAASDKSADSASTAKTGWNCGGTDVPGGEVMHCSQALVIDTSIQMVDTEPCGGITDNPETCSTYTCTAGSANCPPVDTSTSTSTDTTSGGTGTSTGTTSGGTTSGGTGTTTSGGYDNLGGADSKPGVGNARKAADLPAECNYVDACSAGAGDTGSADATSTTDSGAYSNLGGSDTTSSGSTGSGTGTGTTTTTTGKPGQDKKAGSTTSSSSGSTTGSGSGSSNTTSSGSVASDSSSSSSSTTEAPKQYKCAMDKKGNKTCTSIPTCVAGSHASACGACVPDGETDDCVKPTEGGCWVTGGGFIIGPNLVTGAAPDGHDSFGGNAKPMKSGRVQGHWNHVDHGTGNHAKGIPSYIVCRHLDEPGPGGPGAKKGFIMNQVYFGGPAEWRVAADGAWASGYWFDVVAKDHGEPGSTPSPKNGFTPDTYHFTIRLQDDPTHQASGTVVYETKETLTGGNIQMHPPVGGHPYTPMSLPSWVSFEP